MINIEFGNLKMRTHYVIFKFPNYISISNYFFLKNAATPKPIRAPIPPVEITFFFITE